MMKIFTSRWILEFSKETVLSYRFQLYVLVIDSIMHFDAAILHALDHFKQIRVLSHEWYSLE